MLSGRLFVLSLSFSVSLHEILMRSILMSLNVLNIVTIIYKHDILLHVNKKDAANFFFFLFQPVNLDLPLNDLQMTYLFE